MFLWCVLLTMLLPVAWARVVEDFDADWLFSRGDFASAMMPAFDDSGWRQLDVPHDWSIEGPFSEDYGSGNGFAPGGIGWYRKHFQMDAAQTNQMVSLEFDGVYDYAEVWVNGQYVGGRPYGFESFAVDITPYVKWGLRGNVVAVRVDHSRYADSRFYTGSGIYRNVRLVMTDPLRIAHWGTVVTTPKIGRRSAVVRIETTVENDNADGRSFSLATEVAGPNGAVAGSAETTKSVPAHSSRTVVQTVEVAQPQLWSVDSPVLYTVKSSVKSGGAAVDETDVPFGIRTAVFDPDHGFRLNGVSTKLKGVCLHHDAGSLGAAVPEVVLERRLRVLKEIGVNAIRTSHNPPDPALLDLCDRLGFLVMDEAFDEFTPGKNKWVEGVNQGVASHFGYNEIFDQWSVADVSDLVRRDRNHPSVILWSIGNEIDYANDPFTDPVLGDDYRPGNPPASDLVKCARPLVAAVKAQDRTRPVTAALATVKMSNVVGLPELLDAVGYNYQETRYAEDHAKYPKRIIYGSENSQFLGAWEAVETNDFIAGQFLWTGADYLGESRGWPDRASGAGLLDLCSFKKPRGWFRQSLWSDKPMVYLCAANARDSEFAFGGRRGFLTFESWNWPARSTINVSCYANTPEVALFLNDKLIGVKQRSDATNGVLHWLVPFAPGKLRAVGRANGKDVCDFTLQTAGGTDQILLLPDVKQLRANGKDVCQIEYRLIDDNGVRVPNADLEVKFSVTGPARIVGNGNGDSSDSEDCQGNTHRTYQGRGLLILQAGKTPGDITVQASAPDLISVPLVLPCR